VRYKGIGDLLEAEIACPELSWWTPGYHDDLPNTRWPMTVAPDKIFVVEELPANQWLHALISHLQYGFISRRKYGDHDI
jgi:hypothetical protein